MVMYYSFWYNRCCIDPVTAIAISKNDPPEYVDLIRYVRPVSSIVDTTLAEGERKGCDDGIKFYKCACNVCRGSTSAVVLNTTKLETAINMNPMLMQIVRLDAMPKTYNVVYTFIIPSFFDVRVLNKIFKQVDMSHLFVSTRLNLRDDVEDISIFKLHIYQQKTPYSGSKDYIEWMCALIERVINCKPTYYSTNYVSTFTPCSYSAPQLLLD